MLYFFCVSVLDLAKRLPEHLLPEDYSDTLQAEVRHGYGRRAATDEWGLGCVLGRHGDTHHCRGRSSVRHPLSRHEDLSTHAPQQRRLRAGILHGQQDRHGTPELAQDTIVTFPSLKVNCTADTHYYEPPATVLHTSKKATMNYILLHRNTP